MSQILTCPGCGVRLRLPDDCPAPELSCPHCLARIANPASAAAPAGIQTGPAAPTPPTQTTCPSCGQPVDERWRYCPHCEEPLRARWHVRAATVDVDVRRDSRGTGAGLIALAVLGGIAIGWTFLAGVGQAAAGDPGVLFVLLAFLFVLVLISSAIVYGRKGTSARPPGVGRVVIGTLALAGGLAALGIVLVVAFLIFAFIACMSGGCRLH